MTSHGERLAVIDIGTNTLLLLVAEIRQGEHGKELHSVHEAREFGRLGKGLDATGMLAPESVARSLAIVQSFRGVMDELGVGQVRAVGTQALREATNAREFVDPAVELLGAPIEIIAGEREAELVYCAVSQGLPDVQGGRFVIADVGGGSTEVIVSSADGTGVEWYTSIPIGSVRLHERHLHGDPPLPGEVEALVHDVDEALKQALSVASLGVDALEGAPLVASAGTATTIATVAQGMREYQPERVQGYRMLRAAVESQLARLLAMTVAERRELPGLPAQRADVIAAGAAIFVRLLHLLHTDTFIVNDRGVRWGLAYEMARS